MSTLTSTFAGAAIPAQTLGYGQSLLTRLLARLAKPLAPRAPNSDVEAFINANGGVLTDQMERDISRRFGSMAGR